jgi:hypothetical protein
MAFNTWKTIQSGEPSPAPLVDTAAVAAGR